MSSQGVATQYTKHLPRRLELLDRIGRDSIIQMIAKNRSVEQFCQGINQAIARKRATAFIRVGSRVV